MREADLIRDHLNHQSGTQRLYRFKNGYGASVICTPMSYGGDQGHYELAVLWLLDTEGFKNFDLIYDTEVTDDVVGHLPEKAVDKILAKIEKLQPRGRNEDDMNPKDKDYDYDDE